MKSKFIHIFVYSIFMPLHAFGGVDIANGLLDTPSAYVLDNTVFAIGVSMTALPYGDQDFADFYCKHELGEYRNVVDDVHTKNLAELDSYFSFGLFDRIQLGVREYDPQTFAGDVKVQVWKESARWPAISVGVLNIGAPANVNSYGEKALTYHPDDKQNNAYYIVGSKDLENIIRLPLSVHVGVGSRRFQGEWRISKHWNGIFGALEYEILKDRLTAIAEVDGRDLNLGARITLPWGFTITPYAAEFEQIWLGGKVIPVWSDISGYGEPEFYSNEFSQPKFGVGLSFTGGPIYSRAEAERLRALRSRLKRAEERLKAARQRREALERRLEEIRAELLGD
ncbi:MAG: hypothetical protein JSW52_02855 [Candidatus Coatesbacteria bacterium]|nr:MAG: hypothetical protein JSW52_02855 [Candidatus Coatesbacteria bacterium]